MLRYIISDPIRIKDSQGNNLDISPIALKMQAEDLVSSQKEDEFFDLSTVERIAKDKIEFLKLDPNQFACAIIRVHDSLKKPTSVSWPLSSKSGRSRIDLTSYADLTVMERHHISEALKYQKGDRISEEALKKNQPHNRAISLAVGLVVLSSIFLSYAVFNMGLAISAGIGIATLIGLSLITVFHLTKNQQPIITDQAKYHQRMLNVLTAKKRREQVVEISEECIEKLNAVLDKVPCPLFDLEGNLLPEGQPARNTLQVAYWQEKKLAQIQTLQAPDFTPVRTSYWSSKPLRRANESEVKESLQEIEASIAEAVNSKLLKKSKRPILG